MERVNTGRFEPLEALSGLAELTARNDPRFVAGLRSGRPTAPLEYRLRQGRRLVALLLAAQSLAFVAGDLALTTAAALAFLLVATWMRRPAHDMRDLNALR